jgi:2'-hydroxyisoflavone reductase
MKLLILGGTRFLGRHLVAAARTRRHDVALFHRGTQAATFDPHVETIHGDRNHDLTKLQGRRWDAVIDSSGYLPQSVRASAAALAMAVGQYVFISSVSAYADLSVFGVDERAALASLTAKQLDQALAIDHSGPVSAATYGPLYGGLKALCEEAAGTMFPDRLLVIRAGLIAGPYDYTDRFTYWPVRMARGGEVLAPGRPLRHVQFIDVRDLAEWILAMVERRQTGIFNATGPAETVTMSGLLETCRTVSESDVAITWTAESFLDREQVRPWTEMPLWIPEETGHRPRGLMSVSAEKAVAEGLRYRPLEDTVASVLQWYREQEHGRPLLAGMPAERERALLQKWHDAARTSV